MNEVVKASQKGDDRQSSYNRPVALVLQGGGALGSYQAGAYEGIAEAGYVPAWVAGISIGAINAAVIAGNAPGDRVARLREFWEEVSSRRQPGRPSRLGSATTRSRDGGAVLSVLFGQPGLFQPRQPLAWLAAEGQPGSTTRVHSGRHSSASSISTGSTHGRSASASAP